LKLLLRLLGCCLMLPMLMLKPLSLLHCFQLHEGCCSAVQGAVLDCWKLQVAVTICWC
jgi:hypothetical protein